MGEPAIHHPNREKAASKATKAIVVLLLLVSAGLTIIITVGGWESLQGSQMFAFLYAGLNLLFAYYVARWNRGVLTVAAALAILFGVLAAIATPSWFARDKTGFAEPALDPGLLGMLTLILIPVQILLMLFAMRAFSQRWNVEVVEEERHGDPHAHGGNAEPLRA